MCMLLINPTLLDIELLFNDNTCMGGKLTPCLVCDCQLFIQGNSVYWLNTNIYM